MPDSPQPFGQWVRQQRKALDLTQDALGALVNCSSHTVRKIEAGERLPSKWLTARLAEHLQVSPPEMPAFVAAARRMNGHSPAWDHNGFDASEATADPAPTSPVGETSSPALPFVGRRAEQRALHTWLAQLPTHHGRTVLVEGEAGIGKTRLIHELCVHAHHDGLPVARTKCHEIERDVAYRALVALIEQAVAAAPAGSGLRLDGVARAELALLVPALAAHWGKLPTLSAELPQARQVRLFAAVLSLFQALAEPGGLLLVLDDLQWLDDSSAQVLLHLAQHASQARVLLLLACRNEDLYADPRLMRLVAGLRADARFERLPLMGLDRADVGELVRHALPLPAAPAQAARQAPPAFAPSSDRWLDEVHAWCHGNPLFLVAALDEGLLAGGAQPDAPPAWPVRAQAMVRDRLAHLSAPARRLVEAVAAVGRDADFDLMQALVAGRPARIGPAAESAGSSGYPPAGSAPPQVATEPGDVAASNSPASWVEALEELLQRQWLAEDDTSGDYRFVHDSLRETVLELMPAAHRRAWHADVAHHLRGRLPVPHALIAEHEEQAHDWAAAARHRLAAGVQAEALLAVQEGITQYSRGLALAEQHGAAVPAELASSLLEHRGLAHAWLTQADRAAADLRPAAMHARARLQAGRAVELLTALGMSHQRADQYALGAQTLHQALGLARELGDHKACATAMFWLGDIEWAMDHNRAAGAWFEQIQALHRSENLDDHVLLLAQHGLGSVALLDARPQEALAHFRQSLALAQRLGEARLVCECLILTAWAHQGASGAGHADAALGYCDQIGQWVKQADMPWYGSPTLVAKGVVHTAQGDFGAALECFGEALAIARGIGMVRFETLTLVWLAECCLDAEQPGPALVHIRMAMSLMQARGVPFFSHQVSSIEAQALIRLQRSDEVPDLLTALFKARDHRLGHSVLRTLESQTEWLLSKGRLDDAVRSAAEFEAEALSRSVPDMLHRARAWQARLFEAQGRPEQAWQCIERLLGDPTPPRSFGLRVDLQRVRSRCAGVLGLPAADMQQQLLENMLATLAEAAEQIRAFRT